MSAVPEMPGPDMSHRKALDDCDEEESYSPEAVQALHEAWRAYALQVAEECAKVCEERRDRDLQYDHIQHAAAADDCARMIRARFPNPKLPQG